MNRIKQVPIMFMMGIVILICGTGVAGAAAWTVHPTDTAADHIVGCRRRSEVKET